MPKVSDKDKLNSITDLLLNSHIDIIGGYPYDYTWVGDILVIATLDDRKERNATKIEKYTRKQLLKWYAKAFKLNPKDPIAAFLEVMT